MDGHEVLVIRARPARRLLIRHRKQSVEEAALRASLSRLPRRKLQMVVCRAQLLEASVAGLNSKTRALQHPLGTFISTATWEVRVKGIKVSRSAPGDRSLPLDPRFPAWQRKSVRDGSKKLKQRGYGSRLRRQSIGGGSNEKRKKRGKNLPKSNDGKRRLDGIGSKRDFESRKRNSGGRRKREDGSKRKKLGSRKKKKLRPGSRRRGSRRRVVMTLPGPSSKASTSVNTRRNKHKCQCGQVKKTWSG